VLTLTELDETLFSVPGVLNYDAEVTRTTKQNEGIDTLHISLLTTPCAGAKALQIAQQQVAKMDTVKTAMDKGVLHMADIRTDCRPWATTGMVKRTFTDNRSPRR